MNSRGQKVSVIIPTLNEEKYIRKCLESIKNQTYPVYEIIVVDSKSSDKTVDIAKDYTSKVIIVEKPGVSFARNVGAKIATGDILFFVDADTKLSKNIVKRIVKVMKKKKYVGGICRFEPLESSFLYRVLFSLARFLSRCNLLLRKKFVYTPGACLFCRRSCFEKIGGFREDLRFCEDHDFMFKLSKLGRVVYLNTPVFTSIRRYKMLGFVRASVEYIIPTLFYLMKRKLPTHMELKPVR